MKHYYFLFVIAGLFAFSIPKKKKITLWLAGDSTMAIKDPKAWPETGWGMPFVHFWDSTVTVENLAKNGRSTKSFMKEGSWQKIMNGMQEGDYVFIQFGHNDEVPTKANHTTEDEFKANLVKYVTDTKDKKAIPVLLTPVARRKFNANGEIEGTHEVYSAIVRKVASENKVLFIDLDKVSQQLLQQTGAEPSKLFYLHLLAGQNPNYPEGKEDNTHFNELGARKMAELVLAGIKSLNIDLADRIVVKASK